MTSSKVTRTTDKLHLSVLGSNSLRGGTKEYSPGVLGGCSNWFEARLEPEYQKWDVERRKNNRRIQDKYYQPTLGEMSDPFTTDAIAKFNQSGRSDASLMTLRNPKSPIGVFVPPDPKYGHPPPGKWDTMYELTHGLHPYWKEKPYKVDEGGDYLHYQQYAAKEHWRTSNMEHFRHNSSRKAAEGYDPPTRRTMAATTKISKEQDKADPYRPCFLRDKQLRDKYSRSTQTATDPNGPYPPLKPAHSDAESAEDFVNESQVPLQPTWLTGATGRGQKAFYTSYLPPPCWPPPWRNDEAARELEEAANRPAAVQDLVEYHTKSGKGAGGRSDSTGHAKVRFAQKSLSNMCLEGSMEGGSVCGTEEESKWDRGVSARRQMSTAPIPPPLHGYTGHRRQIGIFPKPPTTGAFLSLDPFRSGRTHQG